jgi:hypothetical protein
MPRRIYTYDAGQGWEIFNQMSTWGAFLQLLGGLIGVYNIWKSLKSGERAGNDPWGAPSLEWSIPSPPPEYNFEKIPKVTSRYPLWDVKSPELTRDVPHSRHGDERSEVRLGGKQVGQFHDHMAGHAGSRRQSERAPVVDEGLAEDGRGVGDPDSLSDDQAVVRCAVHDADVRVADFHPRGQAPRGRYVDHHLRSSHDVRALRVADFTARTRASLNPH